MLHEVTNTSNKLWRSADFLRITVIVNKNVGINQSDDSIWNFI